MGVFALVQFWPEPGPIAGALAVMVGVNMVLGNVLEPKVQGDNLGLSPFVILVSMLAWGWLWGFAGLVLAVPMTVIVKIICENVPVLEPVSIILAPSGPRCTRRGQSRSIRQRRRSAPGPHNLRNTKGRTLMSKTQKTLLLVLMAALHGGPERGHPGHGPHARHHRGRVRGGRLRGGGHDGPVHGGGGRRVPALGLLRRTRPAGRNSSSSPWPWVRSPAP
ncbi:MAG: AI-2E family transporter [Desulfomicrobium escambiense]|nr:AI-2E family transporter [Desulfomicrobium escambiense]